MAPEQPTDSIEAPGPEALRRRIADLEAELASLRETQPDGLSPAAAARLRESEERFRTLADAMPVLAWTTTPESRATWYNRRWYEYTGVPWEEAQGLGWRQIYHPDHLQRVMESVRESWRAGEPWEETVPLRRRDGQYRWFLSRAVPFRDAEGRIVVWFGTHTDVTEQRETEAALALALEQQQMLTREVSHRVKNSLQLVASLLNIQARRAGGPDERRALSEAVARVHTIASVHDRLWREDQVSAVDLGAFLNDLCTDVQAMAPNVGLTSATVPVAVPSDLAIRLGLIANELVTNAIKYGCPGRTGDVLLELATTEDGGLHLEVRDWGPGLPQGFQIDTAGQSLGMTLVSAFVGQLEGTLDVSSADPGARFTVRIPPSSLDDSQS